MKVKLKIPKPDNSGRYSSTSFLYRSTQKIDSYRNLNRFGEFKVTSQFDGGNKRNSLDPIFSGIEYEISKKLFPTSSAWKDVNSVTCIITFKYKDGDSTLVFQKNKPHFFLNGEKANKSIIMANLSKIFYRSCFETSSKRMDTYIKRLMLFPPNVMHSVENRTPYSFYDKDGSMKKQEVRINTRIISDKECALEISDGVWANITVKDLNSFINFHRFGQKRSEKWGVAPEYIWEKLLNYTPSTSQTKLMYAFLKQNRTQDLVEQRARELMIELGESYPTKIKLFTYGEDIKKNARLADSKPLTGMLVRGMRCDWFILERRSGNQTTTQRVSTKRYVNDILDSDSTNKLRSSGVTLQHWDNPNLVIGHMADVCVDNIHRNSSLGDQFATRAMTLMNDISSANRISTIHLPKEDYHRVPEEYIDNLELLFRRDYK